MGSIVGSFNQQLVAWQPFFMTMAAICATFAGLLFLALSLHLRELTETAKVNLKRLAKHTFLDFLEIIFVSFVFLVPHVDSRLLGAMLLAITAANLALFWRILVEALRDRDAAQHRRYFLVRMGISFLAQMFLIAGAVSMLRNVNIEVMNYWLLIFAGSVGLLISATRNSWYLLTHELR